MYLAYVFVRLGFRPHIEEFRPDVMLEAATIFTTCEERDVLAATELPVEIALLIVFSAKESLFKALYPQVQKFFGFEAAKLRELDTLNNKFRLQLTKQLAPDLYEGSYISGHYMIDMGHVITIVVTEDNYSHTPRHFHKS